MESATASVPTLTIRFWGTRGSIPAPGPATVRYGGNTSCAEIRFGEQIIILDAGTGIRELGLALQREFSSRPIRADLFVGHTHWDHIQGFPFFEPAYAAGNEFRLYSTKPLERALAMQMGCDYFPVTVADMRARHTFVELADPVILGPVRVEHEQLNHPGGAVGFRVSAGGKAVVYLSDHEPASHSGPGADGRRIEHFVRDADLLICDAQYTEQEYSVRRGWGHGTFEHAMKLARRAGVRRLALWHHDPLRDDDSLDRIVERFREQANGLDCFGAREGFTIELR
jgi:phosphoribosyl 1,2-cyclic phosphodiesterase